MEKEVVFENAQGLRLCGTLSEVDSTYSSSSNAVILCHGLEDSRDYFILPAIAKSLLRKGFCSLRFDFSGNGRSEGQTLPA
jgi:uncharacterized protein